VLQRAYKKQSEIITESRIVSPLLNNVGYGARAVLRMQNNGNLSFLLSLICFGSCLLAFLPPLRQNRDSISRVDRVFSTHFCGTEQAELKASFLDRPGVVFTLVISL